MTGHRQAHLDLGPLDHVGGRVRLPGSKSLSNRTLLLAALAGGETRVEDVLDSDDTRVMIDALRVLGVECDRVAGNALRVRGCAGRLPVKSAELHLGNAGTAFRPLTAVLAVLGGDFRLSGVPRMHERPIGDLVDALRLLGCRIDYSGNTGYPPLVIHPSSVSVTVPVRIRGDVSSQFLSALLMALPLTGQAARVEVVGDLISRPYVEITLNQMRLFGVEVQREGWSVFTLAAGSAYRSPGVVRVEGDASSASYFLAAGAIGGRLSSAPVRVDGVGRGSVQGDVRFAEMLEQMGARIEYGDGWIEASRPESGLAGIDADCNHIPDAAMTLAVIALFARGTTRLRNIASWRVKETDRIAAMAAELRKLGAEVEEGADQIAVTPRGALLPASIATYDDHRMAMCFSLAALGGVTVRILDPGCVAKTYPKFFNDLSVVAR